MNAKNSLTLDDIVIRVIFSIFYVIAFVYYFFQSFSFRSLIKKTITTFLRFLLFIVIILPVKIIKSIFHAPIDIILVAMFFLAVPIFTSFYYAFFEGINPTLYFFKVVSGSFLIETFFLVSLLKKTKKEWRDFISMNEQEKEPITLTAKLKYWSRQYDQRQKEKRLREEIL
ncbi:MAG: hypothetical protein WCI41_02290 [bacterium]